MFVRSKAKLTDRLKSSKAPTQQPLRPRGFSISATRVLPGYIKHKETLMAQPLNTVKAPASHTKLSFNADAAAIAIALSFAALIRLNIIHRIGW